MDARPSNIEMLPLPDSHIVGQPCYFGSQMRDYAHAVAEHNIAARDAEIESLREQLEWTIKQNDRLLDEGRELTTRAERLQAELDNRWAQGVHTCHDKCQRIACVLRRENEALRAEREVIGAEAVKYADKSGRLEAKVERLAEALRRAEGLLRSAGIIAESDLERPHSIATEIKNALRDHDQEGK